MGTERELTGTAPVRKGRGRFLRGVSLTLGIGLMVFGATTLIGLAVAPQAVEGAYGAAKVGAEQITQSATTAIEEAATGEKSYPQIRLGISGGAAELDLCDGTFTRS